MRHLLAALLIISLSSFKSHPITPYPVVGYREIQFFDKTLQTARVLTVWYPIDSNANETISANPWDIFKIARNSPISNPKIKKPLIVISHGYGGSPHQLSWLINKLVYDNYIVLGIQHLDELNGQPQINHWQRAQDVHRALDKFISDPFSSSANLDQIGIAGFSIGGTTAIWTAGGRSTQLDQFAPGPNDAYPQEFSGIKEALPMLDKKKMAQDWRDPRIKAACLMAPGWAWIFDKLGLQNISIPVYIIAPEADHVLITQNNAGFFAKNIPNCTFQIIPGPVNHYIFITEPKERKKLPPKLDYLLIDNPSVNRRWIQFEVAENASNFFNSVFSKSSAP